MNVLALNCGSSSLKYRLIEMPSETELAAGEAQRVGFRTAEPSRIVHRRGKIEEIRVVPMSNHAEAFEKVMGVLGEDAASEPDAIGHRVVHGGSVFKGSACIDEKAVKSLLSIRDLAPLHNPPATALIEECRRRCPGLPQVAVFDTSFHYSIPDFARTYALPESLRHEMGIQKHGFHGISHQYVMEEAARFLGSELASFNAVSCHLGSGGASLCAIRGGKSVDNTMGYCPLQGLVMSTRCGDLDPAAVLQLLIEACGDAEKLESLLNESSGILGLSGVSGDIRDILAAIAKGGNDSRIMVETALIYLWRIRKYLGAYLAVLGRCRAVIFTDTIGESVPIVRSGVCSDMEIFGLKVDEERNGQVKELPTDVADESSPVRIVVMHTNEELAIARRTYQALSPQPVGLAAEVNPEGLS